MDNPLISVDVEEFQKLFSNQVTTQNEEDKIEQLHFNNHVNDEEEFKFQNEDKSLESLGDRSFILHVSFMIVEGLTSAVSACSKRYQPKTLETVFEIVREASKVPGKL